MTACAAPRADAPAPRADDGSPVHADGSKPARESASRRTARRSRDGVGCGVKRADGRRPLPPLATKNRPPTPRMRDFRMPLHEVLTAKRAEAVLLWKSQVQGTLAPDGMRPLELVDHIPQFVDEIIGALRDDAGVPRTDEIREEGATAAEHGAQRLRLGFSLDSVVREYGLLRDAIIAVARE